MLLTFSQSDSPLDMFYDFQPDTLDPEITLKQISAQISGYIEIILMEREEVAKNVSDEDFEETKWDDDEVQFFKAGEFKIRQVWEVQTPKLEYPSMGYFLPDNLEVSKSTRKMTSQPYVFDLFRSFIHPFILPSSPIRLTLSSCLLGENRNISDRRI